MATNQDGNKNISRDGSSTIHNQSSTTRPRERIPNGAGNSGDDIDVGEVFELLGNRRRRYLLYYLWDNDGRAQLGTVAKQIAAWENDTDLMDITAGERKAVYTALQQFHLSKLEEHGIVEFDQRDGYIELGPEAGNVRCCLDIFVEEPDGELPAVKAAKLGLVAIGSATLGAALGMGGVALSLAAAGGLVILVLGFALVRDTGQSHTGMLSGFRGRSGW